MDLSSFMFWTENCVPPNYNAVFQHQYLVDCFYV